MTELRNIPIENIRRRHDARHRTDDALCTLSESIARIGLISPIRVRKIGEGYEVTAGSHRLQALDLLGWREVPCLVVNEDDVAAEMAMIAENVHRAELSTLERDEQISRWIALCGEQAADEFAASLPTPNDEHAVSVQVAPKIGRPESGVSRASRDLGIESTDAKRAVKVASLSDEAKAVARQSGLDDNRSALLAAAKHSTPAAQVKALEERKAGVAHRHPEAADPIKLAERFIALADQIEAVPVAALAASGRLRATVGQRADGVAMRMDEIKERLDG